MSKLPGRGVNPDQRNNLLSLSHTHSPFMCLTGVRADATENDAHLEECALDALLLPCLFAQELGLVYSMH